MCIDESDIYKLIIMVLIRLYYSFELNCIHLKTELCMRISTSELQCSH